MNRCLTLLAALILMSVPLSVGAQGRGHDQGDEKDHGRGNGHRNGRGHETTHWNPAPPKKNGRHDNRDWNKKWRGNGDGSRPLIRYESTAPQDLYHRRQQTKNEWRNLATVSGLVGVLGLLNHDRTLTFAGSAGALYSLYRYEQDRKSQSSLARGRAYYFSKPYFYRDGHRYDRRKLYRNGQWYYQFHRTA